jgi:hypothetical protein
MRPVGTQHSSGLWEIAASLQARPGEHRGKPRGQGRGSRRSEWFLIARPPIAPPARLSGLEIVNKHRHSVKTAYGWPGRAGGRSAPKVTLLEWPPTIHPFALTAKRAVPCGYREEKALRH